MSAKPLPRDGKGNIIANGKVYPNPNPEETRTGETDSEHSEDEGDIDAPKNPGYGKEEASASDNEGTADGDIRSSSRIAAALAEAQLGSPAPFQVGVTWNRRAAANQNGRSPVKRVRRQNK